MEHISQGQIVDAVRGLLSPREHAEVEQHCAGCPSCADSLRTWQGFATFVRDDEQHEPPAGRVRIARAQFAERGAPRHEGRIARAVAPILAALAFDTMDTLGGGVRSEGAASRHLLYEAPPFSIDIHLERGPSERIVLAGQIASARRPEWPVGPARVAVMRGMDPVCVVNANEYGEFTCEFDPSPELSLDVDTQGLSLRILLDRLPDGRPRLQ